MGAGPLAPGETLLLVEAACMLPSAPSTAGRGSLLNCKSDPLAGLNPQRFLTSLRTEAQEVPTSARPPLTHGHGTHTLTHTFSAAGPLGPSVQPQLPRGVSDTLWPRDLFVPLLLLLECSRPEE